MYAIINKSSQQLVSLHKNASDLCQYLEQEDLLNNQCIIFVEDLEELYEQIYS